MTATSTLLSFPLSWSEVFDPRTLIPGSEFAYTYGPARTASGQAGSECRPAGQSTLAVPCSAVTTVEPSASRGTPRAARLSPCPASSWRGRLR
jgi:hypothetical protein